MSHPPCPPFPHGLPGLRGQRRPRAARPSGRSCPWRPAAGLAALWLVLAMGAARHCAASQEDTVFELSLDQLRDVKVQTATKTATPLYAAPAVVTLVTADDLARYGYQSVAEALSHVAGLVESDDGLNHNFGVRGINAGAQAASRGIKILLDGQPIAFRSNQQQWTGLEFIPVSMIERIEIVRGPVSVLYGADALLGAVNVITRRAGSEQRLGLSHEWDKDGRNVTIASGSGEAQRGPWWGAWGVQGARLERGGQTLPRISPDYLRYAAVATSPDDDSAPRTLYLRGGWQGERDELGASLYWQRQDSDNVYASLNPLLRPPSHVQLQQGFVRLNYTGRLDARNTLRASASYGQGEPGDADRVRTGASDYYLLRDVGYHALDASAEWLWQPGENSSVLLGADVLRDRETLESFQRYSMANANTDASLFQLSEPGQRTLRNTGLYLQWQFPLAAAWQAIAGARADHHSVYGTQTSLRAGVVGSVRDWGVKLLGGTAFQAPSAQLLYRSPVQPGDITGNPALAPQQARTVEAQLSTPAAPHWNGTLTAYHTQVRDLVTLEQAFFNLVARNSSDSNVNGVELELRFQHEGVSGYANLSRANTRRSLNRYTLAPLAQRPGGELFPANSANFGASVSLLDQRLLVSLDNRYVGARPAATANVLLANQDYQLSGYVDSTLTARWSFDQHAQLRLQLRDLWNSRYVDPGVGGIDYPSAGRRFGVQYAYRF